MSYSGFKRNLYDIRNHYKPDKWINKFGYNPDVDIGTEYIWANGGLWVPPTQARVHNIVSTDANDNGTGTTGALTLRIFGLDTNYNEINEDITLNGQTIVATTK